MDRKLKRYKIENSAKLLIAFGFILLIFSWIAAIHYSGFLNNKLHETIFLIPLIFSCVSALSLLVIRYRYTIFERYPYLMNMSSILYQIGGKKNSKERQSIAFNMIFTVHGLVIAFIGLMSLLLTLSVGSSIRRSGEPFLALYIIVVIALVLSVFLQYRRIYKGLSR